MRSAAQPRFHLEMALLRWIYLRKLTPIEDLLAGAGSKAAAPPARPEPKTARAEVKAVAVPPAPATAAASVSSNPGTGNPKDALLAEIRKNKVVFYNMVVAQAQKIEVAGDRVTFTFSANQRALKDQLEQQRGWLESIAQQATGRRLTISAAQTDPTTAAPAEAAAAKSGDKKTALREQALADSSVQTMLEVFPAEIRDVEEM
jgi:hypothetical protein